MESSAVFDRKTLLRGLNRLARMARNAGKVVDIALFGGSAIILAYEFRVSTMDVDAIFSDPLFVRDAAKKIAVEEDWPETWLNDGVKGFVAEQQAFEEPMLLPGDENPGVRVFVPTSEYLLAMKCMAMRLGSGMEKSDLGDIEALVSELGLHDARDVFSIVEQFYPRKQISPKVEFGITELFERLNGTKQ